MHIPEQLAWLARGPSWSILTFQGYEINGNIFYTRAQDKKTPTKIAVSVWMPQTTTVKRRHIMVTQRRYGNWIIDPF
jgi:hypothetical protein